MKKKFHYSLDSLQITVHINSKNHNDVYNRNKQKSKHAEFLIKWLQSKLSVTVSTRIICVCSEYHLGLIIE